MKLVANSGLIDVFLCLSSYKSAAARRGVKRECGGVTLTMSSAFDNFNVNNKAIKRIMSEFKEMQKDTKNRDQYFAEPLEVRAALAQLGPTLPASSPGFFGVHTLRVSPARPPSPTSRLSTPPL